VDFAAIKQSVEVERVLQHYEVGLKRVSKEHLRGRCPLPHDSARSRESFEVHLGKNAWRVIRPLAAGRAGPGGRQHPGLGGVDGGMLDPASSAAASGVVRPPGANRISDQLVSKGKRVGEPPLPRLPFSLRLSGWHPYLAERGIERHTAARFGWATMPGRAFSADGWCFRFTTKVANWSGMRAVP